MAASVFSIFAGYYCRHNIVSRLLFGIFYSFQLFKSVHCFIGSCNYFLPFVCLAPRDRKFFRSSTADDDPGTIESIERAAAAASRASQKKKKAASRPPALRDIPKLTKEMLMQNSKSRTLKEAQENAIMAAKKLYELCDVAHKLNREVMVASGQYDVIGPLTQCLLHEPIYHHSHDNDTPSASSSSTIVTLPHQQPRIEGDGIDSNIKSENGHTTPSSTPITPSDQINSEAKRDDGDENAGPPAAAAAPPPNTTRTTLNNKKTTARKQQHRVDEKLHFVCLTLNNLSIPHDNKRVMVRERGAKRLIGNLCKIVASGKKEAHLCCIILMNLTFYEPGLTIIGQFSPTPKTPNSIESSLSIESSSSHGSSTHNRDNSSPSTVGTAKKALKTTTTILKRAADAVTKQRKLTPLENPKSLLRILQDLLTNVERGTSDFRWAFGLLANLSRHPENALLIGLTGIPRVAIENLRLSKTPSKQWATNSLEDLSLYFLLHMAEAFPQGLKDALQVVVPIMNGDDCPEETDLSNGDENTTTSEDSSSDKTDQVKNINNNNNTINKNDHRGYGIQSLKATMICAFLGLEWKDFPDHGVIAAGTVSELMGNTFERVGKKQVYTDNDFALRTAVSAYAALAKAAARADSNGVVLSKGAATDSASTSAEVDTNGSATTSSTASSHSSCVHTKVMALPTSVALLFQIINAIALHWGEENTTIGSSSGLGSSGNESDSYHWDIKAGELAVVAIMSLLPALLEGTGENASSKHHSMATQQACADLSKVFVFFSKKTNSISIMARSAEVAEKLTHSASGSALPLLEASYDLCRNFGTHRVKKNFL